MKNTTMDLAQCPKREYFTKAELTNYINYEINTLKNLNPVLENTYFIKINSPFMDSWVDYFACQDCFVEDSFDLLSCPNLIIWPKLLKNGLIQTCIVIQTKSLKQNKGFLQNFALNYLWPLQKSTFKVSKINNMCVVIDHLLAFKNNVNKSSDNITKYAKNESLICNLFEEIEDIKYAKSKMYNKIKTIEKFQNKYKGEN